MVAQFFLAAFTAEMVLKMIAMGIVQKPGSYLRDSVGVRVVCRLLLVALLALVALGRPALATVPSGLWRIHCDTVV